MTQTLARFVFYVLLPLLGAVMFFGVNPRKLSLRVRLLMLLACSLWVAPFIGVPLLVLSRGEEIPNRPLALLWVFAAGPMLLFWLCGLAAIMYFGQKLFDRALQRWRRPPPSAPPS